ncbi:unnamed protein product, partial [marine sediment metagenome]
GESAHYWPELMLPFPIAIACTQVVLENSEKAKLLYDDAVEAWKRPDCQKALSEVRIPFSSCLEAKIALNSKNISDWEDPLDELKERYRDSENFKFLIEKINQFILVGFNREADREKGKYRVKPKEAIWLFYSVFIGTFVDHGVNNPDFNKTKVFEFGGQLLDLSTLMDGTINNRVHRKRVNLYRKHGWKLRHDNKLIKKAKLWYQVRVIFSGPKEYCCSKDFISEETPDPDDILKEIKICDEALSNQKRRLSEFFDVDIF